MRKNITIRLQAYLKKSSKNKLIISFSFFKKGFSRGDYKTLISTNEMPTIQLKLMIVHFSIHFPILEEADSRGHSQLLSQEDSGLSPEEFKLLEAVVNYGKEYGSI